MAELVINNFTRGQLDHDLNGRFDLPLYFNGYEICKNFISNYKGNIKYRTGFEYIGETLNNADNCLYVFRFNSDQSYLLEFGEKIIRFYSYDKSGKFGYVMKDDKELTLTTNITLAQARKLRFAQHNDVLYLVMNEINPQKLTRTASNEFNLKEVTATGLDFSTVGYPSSVCFYSGRLWYGGFDKNPLTVYGSRTADYDYFTIPESNLKADDPLKLVLSEITDPILWLFGGKKNLYLGNEEGISLVNGGSYDQPITATQVSASLANNQGSSNASPINKDGQMIYVSNDKRKLYMFDYDLMTEKFVSTDLNTLAQEITRDKIKKLVYKEDINKNIYVLTEKGQLLTLLYNKAENIQGWFEANTDGNISDICGITRPDGTNDLFIVVEREGKRFIEKLADEVEFSKFYQSPHYLNDKNKECYNRIIAEELKKCIYLDNATVINALKTVKITYSNGKITSSSDVFNSNHIGHSIVVKTITGKEYGYFRITSVDSSTVAQVEVLSDGYYPTSWDEWYISFDKITGLSEYNGTTFSVVADGGYLGDFVVSNGELKFDREMTNAVFGLPYMGLLKTFTIGSIVNAVNLQTHKKRISEFVLRFVNSGGVNIGTDLYDLQAVQYFNPTGFLDLPPLPMDGDERRQVSDTHESSKCIFVTQTLPLPVNLTMIQYNIDFQG